MTIAKDEFYESANGELNDEALSKKTKEKYCPTCDDYERCVEDYKEASGYCDYYIPKDIKTMVPDQYGMLPKHKVLSFIRALKTKGGSL